MIKNKREREFQIWAAVKVLLVKILFEEVSFKACFEGKEGRGVMESKRKRIPNLCSRKAKGFHAVSNAQMFGSTFRTVN